MMNMAKRVKALLLASAMVVATVALSLVPAQQTEAAERITKPTDAKVTVSGNEFKAGGEFTLTPEFEGEADRITYEVYYPNVNYDRYMSYMSEYPYYYGYYYDYFNHRFVYPTDYYRYYPYYQNYNLGSRAFVLTSDELESGVASTFEIPTYAYGTYTVRVIVENKAGISTATSLIYIKNDAYAPAYRPYYYGYWARPY